MIRRAYCDGTEQVYPRYGGVEPCRGCPDCRPTLNAGEADAADLDVEFALERLALGHAQLVGDFDDLLATLERERQLIRYCAEPIQGRDCGDEVELP